MAWNKKVVWKASILQEDLGLKDVNWTEEDVVKNITGLQVTLRPPFLCFIFSLNYLNYLSPQRNLKKTYNYGNGVAAMFTS